VYLQIYVTFAIHIHIYLIDELFTVYVIQSIDKIV